MFGFVMVLLLAGLDDGGVVVVGRLVDIEVCLVERRSM